MRTTLVTNETSMVSVTGRPASRNKTRSWKYLYVHELLLATRNDPQEKAAAQPTAADGNWPQRAAATRQTATNSRRRGAPAMAVPKRHWLHGEAKLPNQAGKRAHSDPKARHDHGLSAEMILQAVQLPSVRPTTSNSTVKRNPPPA